MKRTERSLTARSNYEQVRVSVTPARDGRRIVHVWAKDKHQGWQFAHLVRTDTYQPLPRVGREESMLLAAIDSLSARLFELEERGNRSC